MPTDAEKLAIAEEIIRCNLLRNSFDLPDMNVTYDLAAQRYCARRLQNNEGKNTDWSDEGLICFAKDRFDCVHMARKRLAAEAARTPEERRLAEQVDDLRYFLDRVLQHICAGSKLNQDSTIVLEARKALEQGA